MFDYLHWIWFIIHQLFCFIIIKYQSNMIYIIFYEPYYPCELSVLNRINLVVVNNLPQKIYSNQFKIYSKNKFNILLLQKFENIQENKAIINQLLKNYNQENTAMIDWQGLLKFSLKFSDGTKASTFTQMTPQNKKWLQQAMQHYTNSEVTRIKSILEDLSNFTQLEDERTAFLLEELQQLLDSLDKGATLYKLGGHIILLKIIFYSKSTNCRVLALQIYSSTNQNDAYVQNQSINTGALEMVDLLRKESDMKMKQNLLTAVSATIRGENLQAKRIFIRIKGLQLLTQLYKGASPRLIHKINVLWRDLLLYDDNLNRTYNDLSHFSNTSNIAAKQKISEENKHNLSFDINQEYASKNEVPENAAFKGSIKKYLQADKEMFKNYLIWLKQQIIEESQS